MSIKVLTPLQGIIYDADGTLLDSMRPQHEWLRQTAERYGGMSPFPAFGQEFLRTYNEWYERKGMPGLYEMVGVDFAKHRDDIWHGYDRFNQTHPIRPVDGVEAAVKRIFGRSRVSALRTTALRLGLNTTKGWKDIHAPLQDSGLLPCFDAVVTKDDLYRHCADGEARRKSVPFDDDDALRRALPESAVRELEKPNSFASWLSLQRLGTEPAATIAFEDTAVGIQSYKAVLTPKRRMDICVIGVTWGYQQDKDALVAAGADEVIDTPDEMIRLVRDLDGFD